MPVKTIETVGVADKPKTTWVTETNAAITLALGLIALLLMLYKGFAIVRNVDELREKFAAHDKRIEDLEKLDTSKETRLVKLEKDVHYIRESQDRIEKTLEREFDKLTESIKEIRLVSRK